MNDRDKRLAKKLKEKSIKFKKKLKREGPIITIYEIAARDYTPSRSIQVIDGSKVKASLESALKNISNGKSTEQVEPPTKTLRIPGKPLKRNFRIDPNQIILLAMFDPSFGMKLARSYDSLSMNDVKKVNEILNRNYVCSNNKPLLIIEKEAEMSDDNKTCCNDSSDCCKSDSPTNDCTNDADTCKKGDDCCKKQ